MLTIVHVYKDYHPILGGIENHMKTLAELQVQQGHRVQVLVTNPGREAPSETINGVDVVRTGRLATVASTPLSPSFPRQLRKLRPDITHLHFPYPVGEVSQMLAGRSRPYVVTYHSDVVKQQAILRIYRPLLRRVLRNAGRILPTSDRYIASSPYLRPLAGQCTVVPLCVEEERFRGAPPLLAPAGLPTLVFVGRHRYYKGVGTLIQALPQIEARLLIGGDGPMRAQWETAVQTLGLQERVTFLGRVSDEELPRLYAAGDLFVLPANARSEAFGKVLLEAMASGLACVTTEVGTGTSFVVQHEKTGLVVPPLDPDALARAINRLLADAGLREQMGAAGRARVRAEFLPEIMVERVLKVYADVLSSAGR